MKKLLLSLVFAAACLGTRDAAAQTAAPLPACNGTVTVVRVSDIKPGKADTFLAAVAAQLAWYRANGVTGNKIYAAPIMVKGTDGNFTYSATQYMTFHINPPRDNSRLPRGDDAYKTFVKMFRESSDISAEYTTCAPAL